MRARLVAILLLSFATVAGAQAPMLVVEDWTKSAVGTKGLPPDWKAQNWGSPKYDFEIVTDENQRALRMKSSRVLGYVWDTTEPLGTVCRSEKSGTVTYFVIRSGTADLGKWLTERRNVCEDYKRVYNEDCEPASAVSVAIDSNDTSSTAEAFVGAIFFKRP
jgi:hypothetical protein